MREYLLGALGVALVYPALWYLMAPETIAHPVTVEAPRKVVARPASPAAQRPATAQATSPELVVLEPAAVERAEATLPAELPRVSTLERPRAPLPLPEALPKTIQDMAELQRLGADPMRLAAQVQAMESNAEQLAELKAFAEQFVVLPPDRVDQRIMNPAGSAASHGRRASSRR